MASLSHHQRTTTDGLRLKQLFGPGRASAAQRCALLQDLVVKWGVNINGVGRDGKTFLHLAADAKDTNLVAAAVALGADCDRKDASGQTPLELALNHDANTIAAMLRVHTRDTAARTLSFEAKSGLAFNVLTQISKIPSPHLKRSPQRLCSQLAPFVYAPPGASVPQAIQFAEQRHALYIRAFSAETLWAWQTHFAGCTTTAWASHLSDIMRVIDIEGSGRMPSVLTRVEEREQIFSLCNTWVLPRQETRLSAKNAFVHAVSQHVAPEQRRALLLLPHTPFGRRLAAGMRNKYEYEVQLWRAFGERVASSPTNITEY